MARGLEVLGGGGEQLGSRTQVQIGIGDASMTEVSGEDGYPAGRAPFGALPFLDYPAGERVPQVVDAGGGSTRCRRDRSGQLAKGLMDGGSRQSRSSLRHQKVR